VQELAETRLMAQTETSPAGRRLVTAGDLDLVVPECPKGIGSVIGSPESSDLIAGVRAQPFPLYPDDRGYFLEVQRIGKDWLPHFRRKRRRFRQP